MFVLIDKAMLRVVKSIDGLKLVLFCMNLILFTHSAVYAQNKVSKGSIDTLVQNIDDTLIQDSSSVLKIEAKVPKGLILKSTFHEVSFWEDSSFLRKYKLTGLNKSNGFMYRLREDVSVKLENGLKSKGLSSVITEKTEDGYVCLKGGTLLDGSSKYMLVVYDVNKNIIEEVDLSEVSGVSDCEIQDFRYCDGHVYFNQACNSYSKDQGGKCSNLFSYDIKGKKLAWKTGYLISNDIFLVEKDFIVSSYGFTGELDFIYLINRSTGAVIGKYPVKSKPNYMEIKDRQLYVIDYKDYVYVYDFKY